MNVKYTVSVLAFGLALYLLGPETLPFSVLGMIIGLVIVIIIGEPMVEGLQEFSEYTGLSSHVTGILSSLAGISEVAKEAFAKDEKATSGK